MNYSIECAIEFSYCAKCQEIIYLDPSMWWFHDEPADHIAVTIINDEATELAFARDETYDALQKDLHK